MLCCNLISCIPTCYKCKYRVAINYQPTINNPQQIQLYCSHNQNICINPCDEFICRDIQGIPYQISYSTWENLEEAAFKEVKESSKSKNLIPTNLDS